MSEAAAREFDGVRETGEVRYPQFVMVLAALADVAFTGAVAVHVAFADVSTWTLALVVASTLLFVPATVVALAAGRRVVVTAAVFVIVIAGLGAAVVAVDSGLQYHALRQKELADAGRVRLSRTDVAARRRMDGAILSGVSASLAAVIALPLAGCLASGVIRADRTP